MSLIFRIFLSSGDDIDLALQNSLSLPITWLKRYYAF